MQIKNKIFIAAIAAVAFISCNREKHYICQCQAGNDFTMHTIGRTSADDAYAKCQAFKDSTNSCYMEVRN